MEGYKNNNFDTVDSCPIYILYDQVRGGVKSGGGEEREGFRLWRQARCQWVVFITDNHEHYNTHHL